MADSTSSKMKKARDKDVKSDNRKGDKDGDRWSAQIEAGDFQGWSRAARIDHAAKLVLFEGWGPTIAAKAVGCSYESVRTRLKKTAWVQEQYDAKARDDTDQKATIHRGSQMKNWSDRQWLPLIQQSRRVGTPWGFQKHYFGHVTCPDCGVHHAQESFHVNLLKQWHHPETRRFLVNLPPYHAKTTVFSIWDTIYDIARDPNSRTLVVSKTQPFVKTIVMAIAQWLTDEDLYAPNKNLLHDFGPFRPSSDKNLPWSNTELYVHGRTRPDAHPNVLGVGASQQIYGRRADRIKADDIATLENTRTLDRITKLMEWIDKELLSRIGKMGRAGFAGTRVGPGDIYGIMKQRIGYEVMSYPAIIQDDPAKPVMLWGDHFGYKDALVRRAEMSDADWQLVYQQVELSHQGLAFAADEVQKARDESRTTGHRDTDWLVIGGVDLAGSRKTSGYTVMVVLGIDQETGNRYLIDMIREKSMTPSRMRNALFHLTDSYRVAEWRVESNAMQEQIIQMNEEITRPLAQKGVRITGHQTGKNKWDREFGVESMVPLFSHEPCMLSVPWATDRDRHLWHVLLDELATFPLGHLNDTAMALWFAEIGAREWLNRNIMPVFSKRRVPAHVANRRRIVDTRARTVQRVPVRDQKRLTRTGRGIVYGPAPKDPLKPEEW